MRHARCTRLPSVPALLSRVPLLRHRQEVFFKNKIKIKTEGDWLYPGQYAFPFQFQLPLTVCPSHRKQNARHAHHPAPSAKHSLPAPPAFVPAACAATQQGRKGGKLAGSFHYKDGDAGWRGVGRQVRDLKAKVEYSLVVRPT